MLASLNYTIEQFKIALFFKWIRKVLIIHKRFL